MTDQKNSPYTQKQGQYLAFIHYYTKLNGRPPAEADMQRYFEVSPPAVHQMIEKLDQKRLIERKKGRPRTIKNVLDCEKLPDLE
jgi:repressor LexA